MKKSLSLKRVRIIFALIFITGALCQSLTITSFAAGFNPADPAGVNTSSMDALVTIVFWAVRILIGAAGGIPSIIKVVQGQTDENPRDRNSGIAGIVATGVGIAATFALEAMF